MAISLLQNGHFFVVGAAGVSSLWCRVSPSLLMNFTRQKITNAVIRKLMTAVIKLPYISTGAVSPLPSYTYKLEKSVPPKIARTGVRMS